MHALFHLLSSLNSIREYSYAQSPTLLTYPCMPKKETLSEVGRQVLAKNQDLISLKVVFLPQVKLFPLVSLALDVSSSYLKILYSLAACVF